MVFEMSTDEYLEGYFVRRNGSCAGGETDCGETWGSFRRCCPGNTECPAQPNSPGICCPTTKNCRAALNNKWRCADPTADLYFVEKTEGYFCCTNDTRGLYTVSRNYAGCAKAKDMNDLGVEVKTMRAIVQYTLPASTSSSKHCPNDRQRSKHCDMVHRCLFSQSDAPFHRYCHGYNTLLVDIRDNYRNFHLPEQRKYRYFSL